MSQSSSGLVNRRQQMKRSHLFIFAGTATACSGFAVASLLAKEKPAHPPRILHSEVAIDDSFTLDEALAGINGSGDLGAKIKTNYGSFVVKLYEKRAPRTVANFVGLARGVRPFVDHKTGKKTKRPFYDGLPFYSIHRESYAVAGWSSPILP